MTDEITLTLNNPLTDEQWDAISDVDFDRTDRIWFHTKHGKEVEFAKVVRCKDCIHGSGDIFKTGIVCAKILSATNCDVIDAVVPKDHTCGWGRKEE